MTDVSGEIETQFTNQVIFSNEQNCTPNHWFEYAKILLEPVLNGNQILPPAQYEEILSLFENYVSQSNQPSVAHFEIGKLLHEHDPGEARIHYEEGLILSPTSEHSGEMHKSLALLLESEFEEEITLARFHHEHGLFLEPKNSNFHYHYACHLKNHSDELNLAREHFEECIHLFSSPNPEIRDEFIEFLKTFFPNYPSIVLHQKMIIKNGTGEILFRAFEDVPLFEILPLGKDANDICCEWIDLASNLQTNWIFLLPKIKAFCSLFLPQMTKFPNSIRNLIFDFYVYFE